MEPLEQRVAYLESVIAQLLKSDRYTIQKTLQLFEGSNIQTGTSTGSSLGTATTQKLSVYGVTPVVQAGAISAPSISTVSGTGADSTINTNFTNVQSAINSLRTTLKNFGISA